jgi:hypothetical protein
MKERKLERVPDLITDTANRRWRFYSFLLDQAPWHATIILLTISFISAWAIQSQIDQWSIFGLNKQTTLAVAGSVFAASIFYVLQRLVVAIKQSEELMHKQYYKQLHENYGVKEAFVSRGDEKIKVRYDDLISKATQRVWAIGMSNKCFHERHKHTVQKILCSRAVDIRVVFWDPQTSIHRSEPNNLDMRILDIQNTLEGNIEIEDKWEDDIGERYKSLFNGINNNEIRGNMSVFYWSLPTNFSCMVVDSSVFFFPYLAAGESWQQPMLYSSSQTGIGKNIVKHLTKIFDSQFSLKVHEIGIQQQ